MRIAAALALALVALLSPTPSRAESEPVVPIGTVDEVAVECDLPVCSKRRFTTAIVAVAGIAPGAPVTEAALDAALARLMETGFFTAVRWRVDTIESGSRLVFEGDGIVTIRKVRIRAGAALASELRRRVFLRSGEAWSGDEQVLLRQQQEIIEYFEDQGFFGSWVRIQASEVGDHAVDLTVRVRRGRRKTVDRIYVRGHEALDYTEVESILLGELNLTRTFTVTRFERAQEALIERYRELGYIQARVVMDEYRIAERGGTVDLFVELREGPRWEIAFDGNTLFDDHELLDALTFYQTGFIDNAEIEHAVAEIQARYETVGHFFAEVGASYSTGPGGLQRLTFDIVERDAAEIHGIRFVGNRALSDAELRAVMDTREYDILSTGGYLQRSRLDEDVRAIEAAYRARGYLEAAVPRVVFVAEDDARELTLTLHVDEGPRTDFGAIVVEGWDPSMDAALTRELAAKRRAAADEQGAPFDEAVVREDRSLVLGRLHQEGYAFATITTSCRLDDRPEELPCTAASVAPERRRVSRDRDLACSRSYRAGRIVEECMYLAPDAVSPPVEGVHGPRVSVVHRVEPGRRITFGHLLVRGNFGTRRATIAREMNYDFGAPYDVAVLLNGQSRLRSLGLFDSVRVSTLGAGPDPVTGDVSHVVVQLEESGSMFFDHRVSLEARATTTRGLLLVLSNEPTFRDVNVFGRAKEVRLFGNFDFDVLDPGRLADQEFRAGAGIVYLARRFYLTRRQRDPWEAQAQLAYDYDLLAVAPAPLTRELALDARVREESDAVRGLLFELGLQLSRTETLDQSDPELDSDTFEPALILSFAPRITLDRRADNPLNPTRGTFAELEVEVADDFIGVLDSERFTKFTARTSGFVPVGRGLVLGLNARFGAAVGGILSGFQSRGRFALPLAERFSLGGVTTLRGFAEGGITSLDTDEFGGDFVVNGNVELRYPFLQSIDLDGAVFFDVGQLMADLGDFDPGEFRATSGFGLRWVIADLLPLVVDYGAVLGRRPGEGFGRLHLNLGYTF